MTRKEKLKKTNRNVYRHLALLLLWMAAGPFAQKIFAGFPHSYSSSQGSVDVNGRIVTDSGRPPAKPVSIELTCGVKPLQVIHTDLDGYFTIHLGADPQSNTDFSASSQRPMYSANSRRNLLRQNGSSLAGCELQASVPGYFPLTHTLTHSAGMGRIEVGTLRLRRIGGVQEATISVASLMVPSSARKEFAKGLKEVRKQRPERARQHFQQAVAQYDQYAAAWNALGRIYLAGREAEKAPRAFEKAIGIDPEYIPPYMNLATLQLQNKQYRNAVETAGKALRLDPSVGFASFLQAVGNYNLYNLDAAEKCARRAEANSRGHVPQLHVLLAEIFLQRQAHLNAAVEMRTYLEESPEGRFAGQMRERLEQIKQFMAKK